MLVAIAPSGPSQPAIPVYGPRRTGSTSSMSSIARIFGAPVIEPPGTRQRAGRRHRDPRELAGDGRDEVLDGRGPLEPAQPRDARQAQPPCRLQHVRQISDAEAELVEIDQPVDIAKAQTIALPLVHQRAAGLLDRGADQTDEHRRCAGDRC